MAIKLIINYSVIDLLSIRLFFQKVGLVPILDQNYISHWIFYPFDKKFNEKASNQSITIRSVGNYQIRVPLIKETNKHWGLILNQLLGKHDSISIQLYQSQNLGDGSISFFNWIAQNAKVNVSYCPYQNPTDEAFTFDDLELTQEEKWILDIIQHPTMISPSDQKILFDYTHRYLFLGDAWTCLNINNILLPH